jgi:hypothetical protein
MGEHSFMAQLEAMVPLDFEAVVLPSEGKRVGLVIVDEVNGFCTVGAGNLAPVETMKEVTEMVRLTDELAKDFTKRKWPIIAFLDTHQKDKPECPYPEHCIEGTGEENLVPVFWCRIVVVRKRSKYNVDAEGLYQCFCGCYSSRWFKHCDRLD